MNIKDKARTAEVVGTEAEHERLLKLWATGKATKTQMLRCMELSRRKQMEELSARISKGMQP